ncbi:PREDICTED: uncharacterized protein LOC105570759 [Vollenhovia emeryi]|uniref:uncharacterized protein LOC105570759 n=1 Tax=Vollenhovia emeryi TaxID=411798 RepID=UPI0005F494A7|nr:PREDICTED: uncharacterized protein LOC105570759 [Vollenhovia emeryi]
MCQGSSRRQGVRRGARARAHRRKRIFPDHRVVAQRRKRNNPGYIETFAVHYCMCSGTVQLFRDTFGRGRGMSAVLSTISQLVHDPFSADGGYRIGDSAKSIKVLSTATRTLRGSTDTREVFD